MFAGSDAGGERAAAIYSLIGTAKLKYSKNKWLTCPFACRDVRKTDENSYVQKYDAACYQNHAKFNKLLGPGPFDAHAQAFAAFGGISTRGIYDGQRKSLWDNMKTAVDTVGRGEARTINARFLVPCSGEAMTSHYLFEPEFCNVASGWEKGIVEMAIPFLGRTSKTSAEGSGEN